jgi:alpha-mannosidase
LVRGLAARARAQDRDLRIENKQCEGVWRASPSLGEAAEVFWGLTGSYGGNYGPPSGYNFDMNNDNAIPVQDDPRLHDYNVQARVDGFVDACLTQANNTRGKHIMLTMGSDFQYEQAFEWFDNLDKLIHHTNLDGRVKVFYSNPLKYTEAKHAENITWQRKTDDFFPYADSADAYWTGYFTSRAGLKVRGLRRLPACPPSPLVVCSCVSVPPRPNRVRIVRIVAATRLLTHSQTGPTTLGCLA